MNRQEPELKRLLKGKIIKTDFGYNMTINEFAKILNVRKGGFKVMRLNKKVIGDTNPSGGRAFPDINTANGTVFNLRKHPKINENLSPENKSLKFVARGSIPTFKGSPQSWWLMEDEDLVKGVYENTWD